MTSRASASAPPRLCRNSEGAPSAVLQHVRHNVPRPGREDKGEQKHLNRCSECPARGPRARYCSKECQRADWVLRHRGECAEARRARQAAGT